jgi:hypothetical protein
MNKSRWQGKLTEITVFSSIKFLTESDHDMKLYQADWCSSNTNSYTEDARFQSQWDTGYPDGFHDFLQSLQANAGTVPHLGHKCFLLNPFQFIIHQSPYHSMLCEMVTAS